MDVRRSVLIEDGPARGRLRGVVRGAVPENPEERAARALESLDASTEAGAPAWVTGWWRSALAGDLGSFFLAWSATGAWLRGWRRGQWSAALGPAAFGGDCSRRPRVGLRARRTVARRRGGVRVRRWRRGRRVDPWGVADPWRPDQGDRAEPMPHAPDVLTWSPDDPYRMATDIGDPETGASRTAWLLPRSPKGDPADLDRDAWWEVQVTRRIMCGMMLAIVGRPGRPPLAVVLPCGRRACPECARRAMSRGVWRYAPLFAAPMLPGWGLEMFTVGSVSDRGPEVGSVIDAAEYDAWRRKLGAFLDSMRRGSSECGIASDTFAGGLAAVELVPRRVGAYVHAHLVAVRRSFYCYGRSRAWWVDKARAYGGDDEVARLLARRRWTPYRVAPYLTPEEVAEWAPRCQADQPPADLAERAASALLGVRELLRRAGLGEVFQSSGVLTSGGAGVAQYIAKVAKYIAKVEGEGDDTPAPWGRLEERPDLMFLVRGKRRIQPFGDVRGLFTGPDLVAREERRWLMRVTFADPELERKVAQSGLPVGVLPAVRPGRHRRRRMFARRGVTVRRWVRPGPFVSAVPPDAVYEDDVKRTRTAWLDLRTLETWRRWADVDALLTVLKPEPRTPEPDEEPREPEPGEENGEPAEVVSESDGTEPAEGEPEEHGGGLDVWGSQLRIDGGVDAVGPRRGRGPARG